VELGVEV
jgi:hypothetical protein